MRLFLRCFLVAVVGIAACTTLRSTAFATWPGEVAVCTASSTPASPTVLADGTGGVIVAWRDPRHKSYWNNDDAVYAQRIDAQGNALWQANGARVVTLVYYALGRSLDSSWRQHWAASDGGGGLYVACRGSGGWLFHYASSGAIDSVAFDTVDAQNMDVMADGAGGVFIVYRKTGGGYQDVYAQHVDATMTPLWGPVHVTQVDPWEMDPVVTPDGSGGIVLAWMDERGGNTQITEIYAQRIDAAGTPMWAANGVRVSTQRPAWTVWNQSPAIAPDGLGGWFVWWNLNDAPAYPQAQRLDASGTTQWTFTDLVSTAYAEFDAAPLGDGSLVVGWTDHTDVFLRRIDRNRSAMWPSDLVLCAAAGASPDRLTLTLAEDATTWVTWVDRRNGGLDLYAQHADSAGTIQGAPDGDGVDTNSRPAYASQASVASVVGMGVIAAYMDSRNGNVDLFAGMLAGAPATAVGPPAASGVRLAAPWPNPATSSAAFAWDAGGASRVDLAVFDVAGRRVRTLVHGRADLGEHTTSWDGRDAHGRRVASGVYFVRLRTPGGVRTRRLTLLR